MTREEIENEIILAKIAKLEERIKKCLHEYDSSLSLKCLKALDSQFLSEKIECSQELTRHYVRLPANMEN